MPKTKQADKPYHHGDLRRVLLEHAVAAIEEGGPAALSLREVARRAGVSHAAPTHHFPDKEALLTAVAADGYRRFAETLREAYQATGDFLEVGVAYVRFALNNRGYFQVMFRPDLYDAADPDLAAASQAAADMLYGHVGAASGRRSDTRVAGVAAWSLVHGFATLWINGSIPEDLGHPDVLARSVASHLFSRKPAKSLRRR